jgi:hypothetical protein
MQCGAVHLCVCVCPKCAFQRCPPACTVQQVLFVMATAAGTVVLSWLVCRRRKLPLLDMRMLERLTGSAAPQDTLIVAAVLASWNPVCARLEHCELQAAAWELAEQRQADSAGRERECERACASGPERSRAAALIGRDAACIKVRPPAVYR